MNAEARLLAQGGARRSACAVAGMLSHHRSARKDAGFDGLTDPAGDADGLAEIIGMNDQRAAGAPDAVSGSDDRRWMMF